MISSFVCPAPAASAIGIADITIPITDAHTKIIIEKIVSRYSFSITAKGATDFILRDEGVLTENNVILDIPTGTTSIHINIKAKYATGDSYINNITIK